MISESIKEKIEVQPSFDSWFKANLSEDEQRRFHLGPASNLGSVLSAAQTAGKLAVTLEELDNNTVLEKHVWDSEAKKDFDKNTELTWAYSVFERYQEYLKTL